MAYGQTASSCEPLRLPYPHQKVPKEMLSQITLSQRNILFCSYLIETLYRQNVSFRDRDLIRLTRCHTASEKFDAELLHNIRVSI